MVILESVFTEHEELIKDWVEVNLGLTEYSLIDDKDEDTISMIYDLDTSNQYAAITSKLAKISSLRKMEGSDNLARNQDEELEDHIHYVKGTVPQYSVYANGNFDTDEYSITVGYAEKTTGL